MADIDALIDSAIDNKSKLPAPVSQNADTSNPTGSSTSSNNSNVANKSESSKTAPVVYRRRAKDETEAQTKTEVKEVQAEVKENKPKEAKSKEKKPVISKEDEERRQASFLPDNLQKSKSKKGGKSKGKKESDRKQEPAEEKVSEDELRARLKSKRAQMIKERSSKAAARKYPLTPIHFCDAAGCRSIMDEHCRRCEKCECFYYCSEECQKKDWDAQHHKMCGNECTLEGESKFKSYVAAREASDKLYEKMKDGDYIVALSDKGRVPACLFTTVAEKSNVLHWKTYLDNSIFTTSTTDALGSLAYKIDAALEAHPKKKIFLISVLLDRLRDGQTTECVIRLFTADGYTTTMVAPSDGKIKKTTVQYSRRGK